MMTKEGLMYELSITPLNSEYQKVLSSNYILRNTQQNLLSFFIKPDGVLHHLML